MSKLDNSEEGHARSEPVKVNIIISEKIHIPCVLAQRRPVFDNVIANSEHELLFARALHYKGLHRESFQAAVMAAISLFDAVGGDTELQEPLQHLLYSLRDLDHGTQDKALLATKFSNGPPLSTAEWNSRTFLVAALEGRIRSGQTINTAAEDICKKFLHNIGNVSDIEPKHIVQWRKETRRGNNPLGQIAWEVAQAGLNERLAIPQEWRRAEALLDFETRALAQAEKWRGRVTSPKRPKP